MSTSYAAEIASAAADIAAAGASVTFTRVTSVYNPATDANVATTVTSTTSGVGVKSNWQKFAVLGLTLNIPQTLKVAAAGMTFAPQPGDTFVWGGFTFAVVNVEAVDITGADAILYTVIANR
jgi:hypothetical protein